MSYINSALRKAQREKDGGRQQSLYGNLLALPGGSRPKGRKYKVLAVSLTGIVFLAIILFVGIGLYRESIERSTASKVFRVAASRPMMGERASAGRGGEGLIPVAAEIYEKAIKAQRSGRWKDAETIYGQVLSENPQDIRAMNNLGVIRMREKRYAEAVELFVRAITVKNDYVDPYYNLACLYLQQGNVQTSLEYLKQAAKIDGAVRKWAKADPDFRALRTLPEFKKITEELVK